MNMEGRGAGRRSEWGRHPAWSRVLPAQGQACKCLLHNEWNQPAPQGIPRASISEISELLMENM